MSDLSRRKVVLSTLGLAGSLITRQALARDTQRPEEISSAKILDDGTQFFGSVSRGLASVVEEATRRFGRPNAYILGQEGSGAFVAGLRYGNGTMYTRNAGSSKVYWQGPSIGFDWGADGDSTMMLVYELPETEAVFRRFAGVNGSAYLVGGFGMTALASERIKIVPIRTGVGARLGINVGYLKFTPDSTWFPL